MTDLNALVQILIIGAARLLILAAGILIVANTFLSAVKTVVLPRSANTKLSRTVFRSVRLAFDLRLRHADTYEDRDRIMALYAPIALLTLPMVWLAMVLIGYTLIYVGIEGMALYDAFKLSGSSLLTLGFERRDTVFGMIFEFSEAALGLVIVALLISYLPAMYSAFSKREALVTMLEVRANTPPSPYQMITRAHQISGLAQLSELWELWEVWFAELEESHTSLAALVYFRSPLAGRSWVTSAGAVLDSAALMLSTVDMPNDPQAQLMIRSGYLALRRIADFFNISYDADPKSTDPISIAQDEFDQLYDSLAEAGVPLKADRDQAWRDYAGWRVNYDRVLLALAALTMAPYAPWVSDRSLPRGTMYRRNGKNGK
ncbi:MAG: hypothetical protein IPK17_23830 [Chloroflexi bacterium]|uniref:hypothetical protein n=1 Tax=Candidatus Flexifilum breve TaxID=3140694 RepID=UPI003135067E|nr:hypothetical protein [Chloroflexota bacterium]